MPFIEAIKRFFTSPSQGTPKGAIESFDAAIKTCDTAFSSIEIYTKRANNRSNILSATDALQLSEAPAAAAKHDYDETVAAFTDTEDFEPYTSTELDAHTAAIDNLQNAFESLTTASDSINPAHSIYETGRELVRATASVCEQHVEAYARGARCAVRHALQGQIQSIKDAINLKNIEIRASNSKSPDANEKASEAAALILTAEQKGEAAKLMKQKAEQAEKRAHEILAALKVAQNDK